MICKNSQNQPECRWNPPCCQYYRCSVSLPSQPFCPDRERSAWLCIGWALVPVRSPWLHQTWMQPRLELLLPTQLEQKWTVSPRPGLNAAMKWMETIQLNSSSSQLVLDFHPFASTSTLSSPDAVAGPTPFRELSSATAAFTSGRRLNAFLEHFSTASSLLEATSCCSLGLNFPLCKQHRGSLKNLLPVCSSRSIYWSRDIFVVIWRYLLLASTPSVSPALNEWCVCQADLRWVGAALLDTWLQI